MRVNRIESNRIEAKRRREVLAANAHPERRRAARGDRPDTDDRSRAQAAAVFPPTVFSTCQYDGGCATQPRSRSIRCIRGRRKYGTDAIR